MVKSAVRLVGLCALFVVANGYSPAQEPPPYVKTDRDWYNRKPDSEAAIQLVNPSNHPLRLSSRAPWFIEHDTLFTRVAWGDMEAAEITIPPGKDIKWKWNLRTRDGKDVQPGRYRLIVSLGSARTLLGNRFDITGPTEEMKRTAKWTSAVAFNAGSVSSVWTAAGLVTGIASPAFGVMLLITGGLGALSWYADGVANDPPQAQEFYAQPVAIAKHEIRFKNESTSNLESSARLVAVETAQVIDALEAYRSALERMVGAELAGQAPFQRAREKELGTFSGEISVRVPRLRKSIEEFRQQLAKNDIGQRRVDAKLNLTADSMGTYEARNLPALIGLFGIEESQAIALSTRMLDAPKTTVFVEELKSLESALARLERLLTVTPGT